ncbi:hypothetical protein WKR03_17535 [Morganella morganii]
MPIQTKPELPAPYPLIRKGAVKRWLDYLDERGGRWTKPQKKKS